MDYQTVKLTGYRVSRMGTVRLVSGDILRMISTIKNLISFQKTFMISYLTLLPYFDNPDPELDTMVIIHFRLLHHVYGNLSQTLLKSQNLLKTEYNLSI